MQQATAAHERRPDDSTEPRWALRGLRILATELALPRGGAANSSGEAVVLAAVWPRQASRMCHRAATFNNLSFLLASSFLDLSFLEWLLDGGGGAMPTTSNLCMLSGT